MAYDDKYRINPAYLNQFRNIAYNDPWFALGELVGRGIGAHMADKRYQKQLDKAENIEDALARTTYHDEAVKGAEASGLINTSTYDGITQAKDAYNKNKTIYDEAKAKLDAFEGDKESLEYKNLLDLANQAQLGMNNASANAEMLRQINRNMGLSNEGYYATDSMGEKLRDVSLLAPKQAQDWRDVDYLGMKGLLPDMPNAQQQEKKLEAPTITEMAQRSLDDLQKNPAGIMSADDIAGYALTTPSMRDILVANHELSKRDPQYFNNLRKTLKKEGISDEVIDEYIGEQKDNVAYGLLGDYYDLVDKGDLYGADATATQISFFNPQLAQVLKTGGVSVNNLFGAQQNALNAEQQAQANEDKERRDLAIWKWKQDYITATRPSRASGGTSEKMEKWEEVPNNLLSQAAMYTQNKDFESAYEAINRLKDILYRDREALDKFPGAGLSAYLQLLAKAEYDLLMAKKEAKEDIDPEYFATVARNAGLIK